MAFVAAAITSSDGHEFHLTAFLSTQNYALLASASWSSQTHKLPMLDPSPSEHVLRSQKCRTVRNTGALHAVMGYLIQFSVIASDPRICYYGAGHHKIVPNKRAPPNISNYDRASGYNSIFWQSFDALSLFDALVSKASLLLVLLDPC